MRRPFANQQSGAKPAGRLALGLALAWLCVAGARAQMTLPEEEKPDPASLFANQCGTCHVAQKTDEVRQGPNLFGVLGRRAGSYPGFSYSPGFAKAAFTWDEARLDAWLTNPQAVIPGAMMLYHQDDPDVRRAIISYLKEQH
jgi:cytochrome c